MIDFIEYIYLCCKAYVRYKNDKILYCAVTHNGVPCLTIIIARDREAWRVTQLAMESKFTRV